VTSSFKIKPKKKKKGKIARQTIDHAKKAKPFLADKRHKGITLSYRADRYQGFIALLHPRYTTVSAYQAIVEPSMPY
jgi:hypothetical protein